MGIRIYDTGSITTVNAAKNHLSTEPFVGELICVEVNSGNWGNGSLWVTTSGAAVTDPIGDSGKFNGITLVTAVGISGAVNQRFYASNWQFYGPAGTNLSGTYPGFNRQPLYGKLVIGVSGCGSVAGGNTGFVRVIYDAGASDFVR